MLTPEAQARIAELLEEMQELFQFENCVPLQINSKGSNDDTPLIVAVIRADLQSVADLLEAGADPNAIGEDDFSALHWAAKREEDYVRVLLGHGAVPRGRNMFGQTPQEIARASNEPALMALFAPWPEG